jgi:autotransporter-associated beta strand protein
MKINPLIITSLLAGLFTFGLGSVQAASITNADASVTLNLGGSWVGGIPPGVGDVGVWDHTVQVNTTKTLGASLSWAGIRVADPGALITIGTDGNTLTLGSLGIDLTAATNDLTISPPLALGANQTWNVTNGLTLNVGGGISGSSLLTLNNGGNNGGTVVLPVANTYTGGTVINGGFVVPYVITSFGTGEITNNGGDMQLNNFTHSGIMVNPWYVTGTSAIDMVNENQSFVFSGPWSGNGTILVTNFTGTGSTLTFGGASGGSMGNFTGSIVVVSNASGTVSAGTLRFNNGGSQVNSGNPGMSINLGTNSTIILANRDAGTTSIGELTGGPGTTVTGQTSGNGTETWSIGGRGTSVTFAGDFVNKGSSALSALTKVGAGTFTLTGTNTFTGPVTVSAGVLQIGDGGADGVLGGGNIVNSASLVFNRSDNFTVLTNNISGGGTVTIQAGGTVTYNGADTSSGTMAISSGDLILGPSGSIASPISVGVAGTFDVSQSTTFSLNQTLSGSGVVTGLVTAVGGSINPGGSGTAGTLNLISGLTESGNINNQFVLSAPGGTNDLINVVGNLTLTGTNYVTLSDFSGGIIPTGTYPLFAYSGTLSGGATNFLVTVVGVTSVLTNITTTTPPEIAVIITPAARGVKNLTWVGDGTDNGWDLSTSNWISGGVDFNFQTGDHVIFNDLGAPNANVNLVLAVEPSSVLVSNTQPYTFAGVGSIVGSTSLTKTNSGLLSVSTTNSYTGQTVVGGGTLQIFYVANGGSASAIGAATSDPSNLVFYSSEFAYAGSAAATDRGATLNGSGVTVDVVSGSDLTLNGTLTGAGALTLVDSGTLTLGAANSYTGGTVLSNGVLATANDTANSSGFGPTNSPVSFYGGALTLFNSTHDDGSTVYSFYNALVVPAGQTGTLTTFERGNVYGPLTGGGMLNVEIASGGYRAGFVGNWSAFTGTLNITGDFRVGNPWGYSNAVVYVNDNSDLDGGNAAGVYSTSPVFDIGELDGTSLATIGANSKPSPFPTWRIGWKNTTSTFAGTIEDDMSNSPHSTNSIVKVGAGTLILEGQNAYYGSTTISNGVLALVTNPSTSTDASIDDTTNIYISTGAFLDVSGISTFTLALNSGQVICGNGTIRGILDNSSGGIVSAGDGQAGNLGILTVTNNLNLGGTTWLKLNRAESPNSDRLVSSTAGIINFESGTLVVTNVGGKLQVGDTFKLFSAPTLQNSFNTIILPDYYTWNTANLTVNGTVTVTGTQALPVISSVDFSQLANGTITLNAINGAPNGTVDVLSTTNLALPLDDWTNLTTTTFDGNGDLSLPVTVDPTLPQSYFMLQAY